MNSHLVKIFDILRSSSEDPLIGPIHQNFYNNLIFGQTIQKVNHAGYFGYQFCKSELFNSDKGNSYQWDFSENNHGEDVVEHYNKQHKEIFYNNLIPLCHQTYDLVSTNKVYQSELGCMLGIPESLVKPLEIGKVKGNQPGRLVAELVNWMELKGFVVCEKKGKYKYILPKKRIEHLDTDYNLDRGNKSKLEAYIKKLLDDLVNKEIYKCVWGIRLPSFKRAPYDFGILNDGNIVGLIEVDGDQHYNRNNYLHKTDESFKKREDIDKYKTELAKKEEIPLLRITEDFIRKNKEKVIRTVLVKFINDITL